MEKERFYFFSKKSYSTQLIDLCESKTLTTQYKTFQDYCDKHNFYFDEEKYELFISRLNKYFLKKVRYLSCLHYYIMEQSGDWGDQGQDQVSSGFARLLCRLKPEQDLSYEHIEKADKKRQDLYKTFKINSMSLEEAKDTYKNMYIDMPWPSNFNHNNYERIAKLLEFFGSKYTLIYEFKDSDKQLIFAEYQRKEVGKHHIYVLTKEIFRSPQLISATVAGNFLGNIYVRDDALWTIFYQKWVPVLDQGSYFFFSDPAFTISQAIKEKALSVLNIDKTEQLLKFKEPFFEALRETIMYHELGHQIMNYSILTPTEVGLSNASSYYKTDDIYDAYNEFFADFCPNIEDGHGAIYNMLKTSKKDLKKATLMFYIYLSDVWFYDTGDEYMYTYSDLIVLIMMRYINDDQTINFDLIEEDLTFRKDTSGQEELSTSERLLQLQLNSMEGIKYIAQKSHYLIQDHTDFYNFRKFLHEYVLVKIPDYQETTVRGQKLFWYYTVFYVDKLSKHKDVMKNYVDEQKQDILKKVMILAAGKEKAEELNYKHRDFIFQYFQDKNLDKKTKNADFSFDLED